jgi:hypothetical protein
VILSSRTEELRIRVAERSEEFRDKAADQKSFETEQQRPKN